MRKYLLLVVLLALIIMADRAHADTIIGPGGQGAGYTCTVVDGVLSCTGTKDYKAQCSYVDGIYTCGDGLDAPRQFCSYVNGVLTCTDEGGEGPRTPKAIDGKTRASTAMTAVRAVTGWLNDFANWLADAFLFLPRWVVQQLCEALVSVINMIPEPPGVGALVGDDGLLSQVPSEFIWVMQLFEFGYGIVMVLGALLFRWAWSKIPFVGWS